MDHLRSPQETVHRGAGKNLIWLAVIFGQLGRDAALGHNMDQLTIKPGHEAERGFAQPQRPFQHRVEDRGEIAGRGVDDAEHLRCGGLLFQGFARLSDQPCVLDGDDRLVGERPDQLDLSVGEGGKPGLLGEGMGIPPRHRLSAVLIIGPPTALRFSVQTSSCRPIPSGGTALPSPDLPRGTLPRSRTRSAPRNQPTASAREREIRGLMAVAVTVSQDRI